jgi:hypothetical protein
MSSHFAATAISLREMVRRLELRTEHKGESVSAKRPNLFTGGGTPEVKRID